MTGEVVELEYDNHELEEILNTLSNHYEKEDFDDFIGFTEFINPITERKEKVIDYIYRHTTGTPRNLVCIVLKLHLAKQRLKKLNKRFAIEKLREIVNAASCESIGTKIMSENAIFLDSLNMQSERQRFLSLIHRNILFKDELKAICREFNGLNGSTGDDSDSFTDSELGCGLNDCNECSDCNLSHPFCELSNIGLLGSVMEIEDKRQQCFVKPHQLSGNLNTSFNRKSQVFLIHPSLNRHIDKFRNVRELPFEIAKYTTVFNGDFWTETNDEILTLQKGIEDVEITERVRKRLNKILGNVYKIPVTSEINRLTGNIKSTISKLKNKLKKEDTSKNRNRLRSGIIQQKQINRIAGLLQSLNDRLLAPVSKRP